MSRSYIRFHVVPFGQNDPTRFEPEFFEHLERRIGQLRAAGIEADLILFHPYDRWGYCDLPHGWVIAPLKLFHILETSGRWSREIQADRSPPMPART